MFRQEANNDKKKERDRRGSFHHVEYYPSPFGYTRADGEEKK